MHDRATPGRSEATVPAGESTDDRSGQVWNEAALQRGVTVGRYVLTHREGAGGMGVVWAAYDPELDRKVAIKVVHERATQPRDDARLVREARALAQLSHPNVVAVHDVGVHEGRVWIAMEFVVGQTLDRWCDQRPWAEIVDVLVAAGQGLAAAHRAGLVHRDIKPANIMVDEQGRARVMDFGLASITSASTGDGPESGSLSPSDTSLTDAGGRLGTPAYMAPEQHSGEPADARTDVFSLCVTAWEALYGVRPHRGESSTALAMAVIEGRITPPPDPKGVPRAVREALERGLSPAPTDRWPTVDGLLAAWSGVRRRQRRRWLAFGGIGIAVALGGIWGAQVWSTQRTEQACDDEAQAIASTWPQRAPEVEAGLRDSGLSFAASTHTRLVPKLDAFAQEWARRRGDACRWARLEGSWSAELERAAASCLDARKAGVDVLIDVWAKGDRGAITRASTALLVRGSTDECIDEARLRSEGMPTDDVAIRVAEGRAALVRSQALSDAGRYEAGLREAEILLAQAEALGWPPLIAEARQNLGEAFDDVGRYDDAERELEAAHFYAGAHGVDRVAAASAVQLVVLMANRFERVEDAVRWADQARMWLDRTGDESVRRAALLNGIAAIYEVRREWALMEAILREALRITERVEGPEHPSSLVVLNNLGGLMIGRRDYAGGKAMFERVLALREAMHGPDHPSYAETLGNLAAASLAEEDWKTGIPLQERALAILDASMPPDHPSTGRAYKNLASAERKRGNDEASLRYVERAIAIYERAYGPDHPETLAVQQDLASTLHNLGQLDRAIEVFERALAGLERAYGPVDPRLTQMLSNFARVLMDAEQYERAAALNERTLTLAGDDYLTSATTLLQQGLVLRAQGRIEEAIAAADRGLELLEANEEAGSLVIGQALSNGAELRLAARRYAEAVPMFERALAIRERVGARPWQIAHTKTLLAEALAEQGDRDRALALAAQAEAHWIALDETDRLEQLRAWRAKVEANPGRRTSLRKTAEER